MQDLNTFNYNKGAISILTLAQEVKHIKNKTFPFRKVYFWVT